MAYPIKLKEKAFEIYTTVTSYEETAAQMRKRFPKECGSIRRQTIEKWALRHLWQERFEKIKHEIALTTDAKIVDDRMRMLGEIKLLRERVFGQIKGKKVRSFESGVAALATLQKLYHDLSGEGSKMRVNVQRMVMIIFEAFAEDDKLKAILSEKQEYLLKAIEEKLK